MPFIDGEVIKDHSILLPARDHHVELFGKPLRTVKNVLAGIPNQDVSDHGRELVIQGPEARGWLGEVLEGATVLLRLPKPVPCFVARAAGSSDNLLACFREEDIRDSPDDDPPEDGESPGS